jgi:hypothetical protein
MFRYPPLREPDPWVMYRHYQRREAALQTEWEIRETENAARRMILRELRIQRLEARLQELELNNWF